MQGVGGLTELQKAVAQEEPGGLRKTFGDPPRLVGQDLLILRFFQRMRTSTAGDRPVDLETSLRFYERLHGKTDPDFLMDAIQTLDSEWWKHQKQAKSDPDPDDELE